MKKVSEFLQDSKGQLSSTRGLFLAWGLGVLFLWLYIGITQGTIPEIDLTVVGILATFMTGKVVQKGKE